jgi:uncharacterized protein (DUF433 family)
MPSKRIKKPIRRKKKSDYPGEMSFRKALGMNPTYYQDGGDYNMQRALELGYTPDEIGHWKSVDSTNGMWLKSTQHPTAWMESMYGYQLNPEVYKNYNIVHNPEGYFGENQLQYVEKNKQNGGKLYYQEDNSTIPITVKYGSPEYEQAYNQGTLATRLSGDTEDAPLRARMLPEVTFEAFKESGQNVLENYPYFNTLTEEEKKYFRDTSPIGRNVRRTASRGREGFTDEVNQFATGMLYKTPLSVFQIPQSAIVEGVQGLRGKDASLKRVFDPNLQRVPSDVWGFENKPGLGWEDVGNFGMDMSADPLNLVGAGLLKSPIKAALRETLDPTGLFRMTGRGLKQAGKIIKKPIRNLSSEELKNLEKLRRVFHNSERFLSRSEVELLGKHGFGKRSKYRNADLIDNNENYNQFTEANNSRVTNWLDENTLNSSNFQINNLNQRLAQDTPEELRRAAKQMLQYRNPDVSNVNNLQSAEEALINWSNQNRLEIPTFRRGMFRHIFDRYNIPTDVRDIDDAADLLNSSQKSQFLRDIISEVPRLMTTEDLYRARIDYNNSFNNAASRSTPSSKPVVKNKSGLTKEETLLIAGDKDKDVISKMSEEEFGNTVLKPNGEVVPYYQGSLEPQFSGSQNVVPLSHKEYTDEFNSKLDLLNDIIAQKNRSGVEYRVKGLDENGRLIFYTPQQSIKQGDVNLTIPSGESSWGVRLNPGQWRGNVEDIANTMYYRGIPGLEMSNTTQGVFADNIPRRGTGAYEAINEYLKRLDLGRVKPGFNSQTSFSRGAWENFIKSGRAVGFYNDPRTVYGTMKTIVPPIAIGSAIYGVNQMQDSQPTMRRLGGKLRFARGGSLTSAQDTAQAADLNKDVMRKDIKKASIGEDFMAGLYGVGEGLVDTLTFGLTDELTDAGFKGLQAAAGHDVNSEEAKRQAGIKGWGNIGGAVGGAFINPGAMGSAIEEGMEGLGQGVKGIDPNSPTATGIGTALEGMGSTKAFTGLNDKDKIPQGMEGFSKLFMARNGGRFRYGYQGGGHMLNQNMGLTEIDGPSHEEGGVTLPNNGGRPDVEVEGPETIYTPQNYVMSEKMKASLEALEFAGITGKSAKRLAGKSYADLSKMVKSKAGDKLRPNDPLSKKMLDKEMKKLMMAHEYDREAKRMQDEAMRSQMMGGSNIVAETPEERAGGYNMYPNAQSIAFPGSGQTSVVPTYNNDPIMVTGADGSQQMLTDEPIETQAPFIEEKMAQGGKMIKRADGSYSRRGLWDNIRANRGSGKKPTKQMLEQEAKIKAAEKAYGGYYAEGGSFDNPGFRALPGYVQAKIKSNMEVGGYMGDYIGDDDTMEYGEGGYTVRRSNDRKGKTHVVTGPDGTKKYFGDPKLGERGKSKYGKDAFYARHKKNLDKNPYFRAYARATWEDGGYMDMLNANVDIPDMDTSMYAYGGPMMYAQGGIHIDPSKRGTFKAQASKMGMGVQEAARTILNAPEGKYSPAMRKKANFARNFAKEYGGYYQMGGEMMQAPQQGQPQGGGGEEQILQQVAQMLQQGMSPEEIVGQLVQMGVPQEQAIQIVQMVVQQMQGQQQAPQQEPQQAPPMMRGGGYMYQMGGEMAPQEASQQGAGAEQIVQAIMQMLQQGMQPEEIVAQLVQMGLPQEAAIQAVQMVMQQSQQGQQQPQPPYEQGMMGSGQPPMRYGGRYNPLMRRNGGKLYYQENPGYLPNTTGTLENILNNDSIESGVYQGADAIAIGNQANANAARATSLGGVNPQGIMPSINRSFNPNYSMTPDERKNWLNKTKGYSGLLPDEGYEAINKFENTMGTFDASGNPIGMGKGNQYAQTADKDKIENYINSTIGRDTWDRLPDDVKTQMYSFMFNTGNYDAALNGLAQAIKNAAGGTESDDQRRGYTKDFSINTIKGIDTSNPYLYDVYLGVLGNQYESIAGNTDKFKTGAGAKYAPTLINRPRAIHQNLYPTQLHATPSNPDVPVVTTPEKPVQFQTLDLTLPRPAIPAIPTPTGPLSFEKYTPWRSNYAPIVAGGLAASAAPLANIVTSFTAEDTRAAAPLKFERPGYEPVALARQAGNQALGTYRSALRAASPTAGAYLSNLAVTAPSMGVNVGKQVAEQRANIDTRRAQIQGQEQMYNDRIRQFNILNQARDEAARNQLRMQGAAGLGDIGQGVITDVAKTIGQEEMLRALETKDFSPFKFERDARGRWRQVLSPRGAEYYMNSKGTNKVVTDSEGNQYEVLPNGTIRKMQ